MKKKFVFIMALVACFTNAFADDAKALVLTLIDGTTTEFKLAGNPQLSFPENDLMIQSATVDVEYPLYFVYDLKFNDAVGISAPSVQEKGKISFDFTSNSLVRVKGDLEGKKITLVGIDGKQYDADMQKTDDGVDIDISRLPRGHYVIGIQGMNSFKILKK